MIVFFILVSRILPGRKIVLSSLAICGLTFILSEFQGCYLVNLYFTEWASLVAQLVKNLPTMWETWVQPLGWEDPLEKGNATHSSILAWRMPWTV